MFARNLIPTCLLAALVAAPLRPMDAPHPFSQAVAPPEWPISPLPVLPADQPNGGFEVLDAVEGLLRLPLLIKGSATELELEASGYLWKSETHALLRTDDKLRLAGPSGEDLPLESSLEPAARILAAVPSRQQDVMEMHALVADRLAVAEEMATFGLDLREVTVALRSTLADFANLTALLSAPVAAAASSSAAGSAAGAGAGPAAATAPPPAAAMPGEALPLAPASPIFAEILATIDQKESPSPIRPPRPVSPSGSPVQAPPMAAARVPAPAPIRRAPTSVPARRSDRRAPAAVAAPAPARRSARLAPAAVAASTPAPKPARPALAAAAASTPAPKPARRAPAASSAASMSAASASSTVAVEECKPAAGRLCRTEITCQICGKTGFKKAWFLARHMRTHTKERPFKCRACEAAFTTKPNRDRHEKAKHNLERPPKHYPCKYCSKVLQSECYLASHIRNIHADEETSPGE